MKQKISVAARPSKPKDLSRNHYTTLNFGHIYPIYVEEFCNGSKVSIKTSNFSRVAPQFLPNLGRLDMKLHAFYVPYHLVWNHFENFNEGLPSWNNQGSQVYKYTPTFNDCDLTHFFMSRSELASDIGQPSASDPFDFQVLNPNGLSSTYYKFTPLGKYVYHVFNALGYNFTFVRYGSPIADSLNAPKSCLPLLCFFKLYLDYFIPSQLQPSSSLHKLFQWLHEQTANTFYLWYNNTGDNESATLKQDMMNYIFDFIEEMFYYYQNNYFTSAWMSPNAPVPGLNNIGQSAFDRPVINSISSQGNASDNSILNQSIANTDNGVQRVQFPSPTLGNVSLSPSISQLTSDGMTFMHKFARFVKRSNFVGSRAIERILGKFGIRITDFESSLSTYLGSTSFVMNQADVTVTGSLSESGDYTGKGWFNSTSQNERIFKCNMDLYGMVFVTASIETPSMFVEGVRRRNMHIQPLDFYNPDLDGSLMQAISGSELFSRNPFATKSILTNSNFFGLLPRRTFGYQLRYMEMKTAIDDISGDFCVPTLNKNIDQFILPRRLFDIIQIHDIITHDSDDPDWRDYAYSPSVADGNAVTPVSILKGDDMNQFNRIFRQSDGSADPIYAVFRFDVICNNSVMPANTSAELDGRGKEIEFETNGVHV